MNNKKKIDKKTGSFLFYCRFFPYCLFYCIILYRKESFASRSSHCQNNKLQWNGKNLAETNNLRAEDSAVKFILIAHNRVVVSNAYIYFIICFFSFENVCVSMIAIRLSIWSDPTPIHMIDSVFVLIYKHFQLLECWMG